ncbi:hypothetical protein TVAG_488920 [Trichomonas vaginalis G3]|uniref:Uncharacterized protein n=1 Tax=Trichomonas vaginalis (strain ATCC PRA-98 / G3) TaxID=412133 RepID=A2FL64_TRIV3|nr:hypothetical protein TVAGG3_0426930 [Trichomonas vaginalis G3]EAX94353.1 hypothetical protein TVAG_488920 [Trichomonas vaginalis G3]KAI5536484.1 hypothetical protein TVAGG3_0426930 [Trichomonas vaginalis G3]|eukprot:XP_001307283.1 hypothetical protein [Trichomonas vaginalis G3]
MRRNERVVSPLLDLEAQERYYRMHYENLAGLRPTINTSRPDEVPRLARHKKNKKAQCQFADTVSNEIYGLITAREAEKNKKYNSPSKTPKTSRRYVPPDIAQFYNSSPTTKPANVNNSPKSNKNLFYPSPDIDSTASMESDHPRINIKKANKVADINDSDQKALERIVNKKIQEVKRNARQKDEQEKSHYNLVANDLPSLYLNTQPTSIYAKSQTPPSDKLSSMNTTTPPNARKIKFVSSSTDDSDAAEYLSQENINEIADILNSPVENEEDDETNAKISKEVLGKLKDEIKHMEKPIPVNPEKSEPIHIDTPPSKHKISPERKNTSPVSASENKLDSENKESPATPSKSHRIKKHRRVRKQKQGSEQSPNYSLTDDQYSQVKSDKENLISPENSNLSNHETENKHEESSNEKGNNSATPKSPEFKEVSKSDNPWAQNPINKQLGPEPERKEASVPPNNSNGSARQELDVLDNFNKTAPVRKMPELNQNSDLIEFGSDEAIETDTDAQKILNIFDNDKKSPSTTAVLQDKSHIEEEEESSDEIDPKQDELNNCITEPLNKDKPLSISGVLDKIVDKIQEKEGINPDSQNKSTKSPAESSKNDNNDDKTGKENPMTKDVDQGKTDSKPDKLNDENKTSDKNDLPTLSDLLQTPPIKQNVSVEQNSNNQPEKQEETPHNTTISDILMHPNEPPKELNSNSQVNEESKQKDQIMPEEPVKSESNSNDSPMNDSNDDIPKPNLSMILLHPNNDNKSDENKEETPENKEIPASNPENGDKNEEKPLSLSNIIKNPPTQEEKKDLTSEDDKKHNILLGSQAKEQEKHEQPNLSTEIVASFEKEPNPLRNSIISQGTIFENKSPSKSEGEKQDIDVQATESKESPRNEKESPPFVPLLQPLIDKNTKQEDLPINDQEKELPKEEKTEEKPLLAALVEPLVNKQDDKNNEEEEKQEGKPSLSDYIQPPVNKQEEPREKGDEKEKESPRNKENEEKSDEKLNEEEEKHDEKPVLALLMQPLFDQVNKNPDENKKSPREIPKQEEKREISDEKETESNDQNTPKEYSKEGSLNEEKPLLANLLQPIVDQNSKSEDKESPKEIPKQEEKPESPKEKESVKESPKEDNSNLEKSLLNDLLQPIVDQNSKYETKESPRDISKQDDKNEIEEKPESPNEKETDNTSSTESPRDEKSEDKPLLAVLFPPLVEQTEKSDKEDKNSPRETDERNDTESPRNINENNDKESPKEIEEKQEQENPPLAPLLQPLADQTEKSDKDDKEMPKEIEETKDTKESPTNDEKQEKENPPLASLLQPLVDDNSNKNDSNDQNSMLEEKDISDDKISDKEIPIEEEKPKDETSHDKQSESNEPPKDDKDVKIEDKTDESSTEKENSNSSDNEEKQKDDSNFIDKRDEPQSEEKKSSDKESSSDIEPLSESGTEVPSSIFNIQSNTISMISESPNKQNQSINQIDEKELSSSTGTPSSELSIQNAIKDKLEPNTEPQNNEEESDSSVSIDSIHSDDEKEKSNEQPKENEKESEKDKSFDSVKIDSERDDFEEPNNEINDKELPTNPENINDQLKEEVPEPPKEAEKHDTSFEEEEQKLEANSSKSSVKEESSKEEDKEKSSDEEEEPNEIQNENQKEEEKQNVSPSREELPKVEEINHDDEQKLTEEESKSESSLSDSNEKPKEESVTPQENDIDHQETQNIDNEDEEKPKDENSHVSETPIEEESKPENELDEKKEDQSQNPAEEEIKSEEEDNKPKDENSQIPNEEEEKPEDLHEKAVKFQPINDQQEEIPSTESIKNDKEEEDVDSDLSFQSNVARKYESSVDFIEPSSLNSSGENISLNEIIEETPKAEEETPEASVSQEAMEVSTGRIQYESQDENRKPKEEPSEVSANSIYSESEILPKMESEKEKETPKSLSYATPVHMDIQPEPEKPKLVEKYENQTTPRRRKKKRASKLNDDSFPMSNSTPLFFSTAEIPESDQSPRITEQLPKQSPRGYTSPKVPLFIQSNISVTTHGHKKKQIKKVRRPVEMSKDDEVIFYTRVTDTTLIRNEEQLRSQFMDAPIKIDDSIQSISPVNIYKGKGEVAATLNSPKTNLPRKPLELEKLW